MRNDPTSIDSKNVGLIGEAKRRHLEADTRLQYSADYAQAGLKSLFLANGGAIVALLTLVGNTDADFNSRGLFWSFVWFGSGLVACLLAYFSAANAQNELMNSAYNQALNAEYRAAGAIEDADPATHERNADLSLGTAGVLAIGSVLLFIIGAFVALFAIT
ncbi:MAG: hypothetical protein AAGA34_01790 [Pseudomonadota bacterium]